MKLEVSAIGVAAASAQFAVIMVAIPATVIAVLHFWSSELSSLNNDLMTLCLHSP
jgi:hypothetical protein